MIRSQRPDTTDFLHHTRLFSASCTPQTVTTYIHQTLPNSAHPKLQVLEALACATSPDLRLGYAEPRSVDE